MNIGVLRDLLELGPGIFVGVIAHFLESKKEEVIDNGYGKLDKKRLGYSIETLDGNKIIPSNTNVKDAVAGKFAGVKIGNNDDLSQFVGRGRYTTILGNQYGLVVVDGLVIKQSNSSRDAGFIALNTGLASGALDIILPEENK